MLKPIAQELAETIARTIGYHVVITDTEGIIIGCSDPNRGLGTLNEACAQVAATGQSRWETEEDAKKLKGTLPGVTYPIMDMEDRVVGTVAITGDPDKVRPFALLVKSQAELFLRERFIAGELRDRERNFQALVNDIALFREGVNDPRVFETRAAYMGYDKKRSYIMLVVDTAESTRPSEESERVRFMSEMRRVFDDNNDLSGPVGPNRYAVFVSLSQDEARNRVETMAKMRDKAHRLLSALQERGYVGRVGVGGIYSGVTGLANSYNEAMEALQIGRQIYPEMLVHCIIDYRMEELLLSGELALQDSLVNRELAPLFARNDGDELQDTILAWCESGFSVVKASETLHVHRTTVDYRLEKLQTLLSIDPRDFRQMSRVYWAVLLWRNGRGDPTLRRRPGRRRSFNS